MNKYDIAKEVYKEYLEDAWAEGRMITNFAFLKHCERMSKGMNKDYKPLNKVEQVLDIDNKHENLLIEIEVEFNHVTSIEYSKLIEFKDVVQEVAKNFSVDAEVAKIMASAKPKSL